MQTLIAWIGTADLAGPEAQTEEGSGPIAQAVRWRSFDQIHLLADQKEAPVARFRKWLSARTKAAITVHACRLSSPMAFGEIYEAAVGVVSALQSDSRADHRFVFHLSPGTSAMCAVWIILAKTRFPATLIQSSREHAVQVAQVPFELSADYLGRKIHKADEDLIALSQGLPPPAAEFDKILHKSDIMKRTVIRARRVAPRSLPVLLLGESGVGKELFARAIHQSSPRRGKPFIAVNCGAIPSELVDSELFGHEKGAFTGANLARTGHLVEANGGTLFLDEVGELPLHAQVRLLRALQEREVTPVGSSRPRKVDFRLLTATHRDLPRDVYDRNFREDLFHRIAVAIIAIPPLRERGPDLSHLIDFYLEKINIESADQPGHERKKISAGARNLLLQHSYPGNVRELMNILQRAIVWSPRATISTADIRDAILPAPSSRDVGILNRPLDKPLDLQELHAEVARHYMKRALHEAQGNKTRAAELVGLPSYQTFTNWMTRYGVVDDGPGDLA